MSDPRLHSDPDFILMKRFGYSLKRLLARYPDEVPDETIALALGISKESVEPRYQAIVQKLRVAVAA